MSTQAFDFAHLVAAIQQTHVALADQAAKAVNISLTLRNWFIGHHIAEFELQGADRARYGDKLLAELALAGNVGLAAGAVLRQRCAGDGL